MSSILNDTKKLLGIPAEHTAFDPDIIMHINTVFNVLYQIGAGPKDSFMITDDTAQWEEYETDVNLNLLKSYMYAKVRMMFDPPAGAVKEALENTITELEFRINVYVDPGDTFDEEEDDDG